MVLKKSTWNLKKKSLEKESPFENSLVLLLFKTIGQNSTNQKVKLVDQAKTSSCWSGNSRIANWCLVFDAKKGNWKVVAINMAPI